METIAIQLKTDITTITAELEDCQTVREFLATLPRTLTMKQYMEREYYSRIESISDNGPAVETYADGDVAYYPAGPSFVLFYAGAAKYTQPGLIRMGNITSSLTELAEGPEFIHVTIEQAQ